MNWDKILSDGLFLLTYAGEQCVEKMKELVELTEEEEQMIDQIIQEME